RARAASGRADRAHDLGGNLGRDPRAEALGLDHRDGLDRAGPRGEPAPAALPPGPVGPHDAEATDHDVGPAVVGSRPAHAALIAPGWASSPQACPFLARMNRDSESMERN